MNGHNFIQSYEYTIYNQIYTQSIFKSHEHNNLQNLITRSLSHLQNPSRPENYSSGSGISKKKAIEWQYHYYCQIWVSKTSETYPSWKNAITQFVPHNKKWQIGESLLLECDDSYY